nr:MarR family transcriptional regulator [Rhodococcus wratislaviensis]GLK41102.1 hypothetical protein GCM10017611_79770 [Rhodococcus wratislaviensis]
MNALPILQAVRLKGRVSRPDLSITTGLDESSVETAVAELISAGHLTGDTRVRLTIAGREKLSAMLSAERSGIDSAVITEAYARFCDVNGAFKALVTEWQLKDGEPNDHTDADYDTAILTRLFDVHDQVIPIIADVAAVMPRVQVYADKLCTALKKVQAGDTSWFTMPIADSYHTVWFELHEELIGAAGLTREEEAQAGHAQ